MVCCTAGILCILMSGCIHFEGIKKKNLEDRVHAAWQAKTDKKWESVYDFFCADYKEKITKQKFLQGSNLDVQRFTISEISYTNNQQNAKVIIRFDARARGFDFKGIQLGEDWVYENGNWFFCPENTGFRKMFPKGK